MAGPVEPPPRVAGDDAADERVPAEPVDAFRVAGFLVAGLRVVAFRVAGFLVVDDVVRRGVDVGFAVVAAAGDVVEAAAAGLADDLVVFGFAEARRLVAAFADAGRLVADLAEADLVVAAFAVADRLDPEEAVGRFDVARAADAGLAADGTAFAAAALARVPAAAARVPAALPAVFARVAAALARVPAAAFARVPAARARVPVVRVAAAPRVVAAFRVVVDLADPLPAVRPPRNRDPALIGETACAAVAAAEPTSIAVAPSARAPVPAAARARSPMRATREATSAAALPAWRCRFATCLRPLVPSAFASWPRRFASVARAASSCLPSFRISFAAFPVTGADACCAAATRSPTAPRTSAGTLEPLALGDPFVDFAIVRFSLSSSAPVCKGGSERYHPDINAAEPIGRPAL